MLLQECAVTVPLSGRPFIVPDRPAYRSLTLPALVSGTLANLARHAGGAGRALL